MRSSRLLLTELYSSLPQLENLVVLGVEMTAAEAHDARSFPFLLVEKQASHLKELEIRIDNDDDEVRPLIDIFPSFCTQDLHIPQLTTLTISAQLLNSLTHEQQIAAFFRTHSSTLRTLHIRGLWLASNSAVLPGLATVLDNSPTLTNLSLVPKYLQASHLGFLASSLPRLERLTLNIEYIISNSGGDAAIPSDIFPKWHESPDYTHPFVNEIKQCSSLQQWRLQDITIQRRSCCGVLVLWGLMRLCAEHVPSVCSFMDNGDMEVPIPANVPPTPAPTIFCDSWSTNCEYGGTINEDVLKRTLKRLLLAIDYLHSVAKIIHTDIQENNILFSIEGDSDLVEFEQQEKTKPSRRKTVGNRIIFESRDLIPTPDAFGHPMLCDFGEARFMKDAPCLGLIQPRQYRAPEVILDMPWDEKVDIWSIGMMIWDMFYGHNLFDYRGIEGEPSKTYHLAQMVALLGPPPKDFLQRSTTDALCEWFDEEGNWKAPIQIPDTSLEEAENRLEGEDKIHFLKFIRRMLKWKPEERSSACELLEDDWLKDASK
ncbi:hypothetical protein NLJ89_g2229 [Agrocybe chaxingu]|uniref:Protein kinase domain-containing protein n=1 Tax=Agrocybe chaxingu TaxID=84603 RepID=A0A9W8K711_9AGAR|nr:hypothetical protein NLJ89_g2229 [Agrocybe chaxingu]